MPQFGRSTVHHCVGASVSIGNIPASNCRSMVDRRSGKSYCDVHEMPCRNGCKGWYHLRNQWGCGKCVGNDKMAVLRDNQKKEKAREEAEKKKKENDFWAKHEKRNAKKEAKKNGRGEE